LTWWCGTEVGLFPVSGIGICVNFLTLIRNTEVWIGMQSRRQRMDKNALVVAAFNVVTSTATSWQIKEKRPVTSRLEHGPASHGSRTYPQWYLLMYNEKGQGVYMLYMCHVKASTLHQIVPFPECQYKLHHHHNGLMGMSKTSPLLRSPSRPGDINPLSSSPSPLSLGSTFFFGSSLFITR
jgi:hypothetical protein